MLQTKRKEGIELLLLGIHDEVAREARGEITWSSSGWDLDGILLLCCFLSLQPQAHIGDWVARYGVHVAMH